jgi:16S rRNA (guanine1207-N2)-methyltransferase
MSHYFDHEPTGRSDERTVEVTLPDLAFTMTTDRGVFSHGRLDTGTNLLLRTAPALPPSGHLLDLGCGAGPIALTMAQRSPGATVHAVDVNARARDLCVRNAAAIGLTNVQVSAPDDVDHDLRFAAIWSNPPIRIGKPALQKLLTTWLVRLTPDGTAVLVAQRHLGADSLHQWLDQQGHPTTRLTSRAGYRILRINP